jgi:carbonic anhydrase
MSFNWEPFGRSRNEGPAPAPAPAVPASAPAPQLVVLTCMDFRIDTSGLAGEAFVLRNAGAQCSEDVVRSLKLSRGLGVTRVRVMGHTDCAAYDRDDAAAEAGAREAAEQIRAAIPELEVDVKLLDINRPAE